MTGILGNSNLRLLQKNIGRNYLKTGASLHPDSPGPAQQKRALTQEFLSLLRKKGEVQVFARKMSRKELKSFLASTREACRKATIEELQKMIRNWKGEGQ